MNTKRSVRHIEELAHATPGRTTTREARPYRSSLAAGVVAMGLCLGLTSPSAQALVLTEGSADCSGNETAKPAVNMALQSSGCANAAMTEFYKSDADDGAESGTFANAYETVYGLTPLSPTTEQENATISAMGSDTPIVASDYSDLWALAKDGDNSPAWYGWNLTDLGWNGSEDFVFDSLWANHSGAISHLSIFGAEGPATAVPAPAAIGLLGLGLVGLGLSSRRQHKVV